MHLVRQIEHLSVLFYQYVPYSISHNTLSPSGLYCKSKDYLLHFCCSTVRNKSKLTRILSIRPHSFVPHFSSTKLCNRARTRGSCLDCETYPDLDLYMAVSDSPESAVSSPSSSLSGPVPSSRPSLSSISTLPSYSEAAETLSSGIGCSSNSSSSISLPLSKLSLSISAILSAS